LSVQISLSGDPADVQAMLQYLGRQPKISDFAQKACQIPVAETLQENQIAYSPHPRPSKEATAKLRAIFGDYVKAGMTSQAIQEDLVKSWDICLSLKQIAGWIGQVKLHENTLDEFLSDPPKMTVRPKGATSHRDETITQSMGQSAILGHVVKPEPILAEPDLTIWTMHQKGNMDYDIKQALSRMGHNIKVMEIRGRIDAMKKEMA